MKVVTLEYFISLGKNICLLLFPSNIHLHTLHSCCCSFMALWSACLCFRTTSYIFLCFLSSSCFASFLVCSPFFLLSMAPNSHTSWILCLACLFDFVWPSFSLPATSRLVIFVMSQFLTKTFEVGFCEVVMISVSQWKCFDQA